MWHLLCEHLSDLAMSKGLPVVGKQAQDSSGENPQAQCVCVCVCVCVCHPLYQRVQYSTGRGRQQERESAANEDTLDFLVILGLIIPAYLP